MPKITDPESLVKRAARALTTLRGALVTPNLIDALADVLVDEFHGLHREEAVEVLSIRRIRGAVLTDEIIEERARQIAVVLFNRSSREAA